MSGKLHQQQQGGFLEQLLQQFSQSGDKRHQLQQLQQQQGGVKNKKSKSVKTKRRGGGDDPDNESEKVQLQLYKEQMREEEERLAEVYRRDAEKWKNWEETKEAVLEKQKQEQNQINYDGHTPLGGQFAGNVKVYTGPKQGKFIINKKGKKVYIDRKTLNNNVPYLKKKAKKGKAKVAK
jgi:hypothetical protein